MEQKIKYKSINGGIKKGAIILFVFIALIGSVEAATYTPGQVMNTVSKYMTPQNAINPTNPMQNEQTNAMNIYIYKLPTNPLTYVYTSSAAIDCDGQSSPLCKSDPTNLGQTSFTQNDGKPLAPATLPWYVLPETPNPIFDYAKLDIQGGQAGLVLYNNKMEYGVFGDERGRDVGNNAGKSIGEVSYAMAVSLGIPPDPDTGGVDNDVTYIIFTTKANVVVPIESHAIADTKGESALNVMMSQLGTPTPTISPKPASTPTPDPTARPTPTSTPSPTPNLLANPGFESGTITPINWTFVTNNGSTPSWDANVFHTGLRSIKIKVTGTQDNKSGYPKSDLIKLLPNTTYNFSAWGMTESAGGTNAPAVRIVELNSALKMQRQTNIVFSKGSNAWAQKSIIINTTSNTSFAYVYANIWNGYGTFRVDDVEVTSDPTASPTPTSVQINTKADTYISSITPTKNYGKSAFLYIDEGRRGYFRYDVSAIPSTAIVTTVELHDFISWSSATGTANIYAVTGAWNETGINWNNKPANESVSYGVYNISKCNTGNGDCVHVVTGFEKIVQRWINKSLSNNGMMITTPKTISDSELDSRETSYIPYLVVKYK